MQNLKPLTLKVTDDMLTDLEISLDYNPISGDTEIGWLKKKFFGNPEVQVLGLAKSYLNEHGYSHVGLEDFLLYCSHEYAINPVAERILPSHFWDKRNRLRDLLCDIFDTTSSQETVFLEKWLHQALAVGINDDEKPYSPAGIPVFYGRWDIAPLLEKLTLDSDEFLTQKAHIDLKDKDSLRKATSTWITELDGFYPEAQSFLLASQDMHRPMFAKKDMPKTRRTSFCVSVRELPANLIDYRLADEEDFTEPVFNVGKHTGCSVPVFWPICTDNLDTDRVAALDKRWVQQLWLQIYEELYIPNPKGYTLTAHPDQENSAYKFFATQLRFTGKGEKSAERAKIYAVYQMWCKFIPEDRVMKDEENFFKDVEQLIDDMCLYNLDATEPKDDKSCLRGFTFVDYEGLMAFAHFAHLDV